MCSELKPSTTQGLSGRLMASGSCDDQEPSSGSDFRKPAVAEIQSCSPTGDFQKSSSAAIGCTRASSFSRIRVSTHNTFIPFSPKAPSRYSFSPALRPMPFNEASPRPRDMSFLEDECRSFEKEVFQQTSRGCTSVVPVRIFLPKQYAGCLNHLDNTLLSHVDFYSSYISTQASCDNRFPGVAVSIFGLSREALLKVLIRLCRKIGFFISQNLASFTSDLSDSDWLLRGIIALVPERAVSMVIGYKGTTINRMCKRFNCDIRMLPNQKVQIQFGLTDRLVLFRSGDMTNVSKAICHINFLLNGMIRQGRLTEADFSCPLSNSDLHYTNVPALTSPPPPPKAVPCHLFRAVPHPEESSASQAHQRLATPTINPTQNVLLTRQKRSIRRFFQDHRFAGVPRLGSFSLQPWAFSVTPHLFRHVMNNTKDSMSLKLVVDKLHAAWIIGNSGAHKKWLESTSGATINIYNRSVENFVEHFRDSRVMIIRGTPLMLSLAVNLVFVGYEIRERHVLQTHESSVHLILSRECSSLLLEKGVRVLKAIAYRSGVKVSLLPHVQLDRNMINLKGYAAQKVTALILILEYLLRKKKRLDVGGLKKNPLNVATKSSSPRPSRSQPIEKSCTPSHHNEQEIPYQCKEAPQHEDKSTVVEPPEASFLRHVSNNITYPKVITTSSKYSMMVTFPSKYRTIISKLGPTAFNDIEAMLNYRVGSCVRILRKDAPLSQEKESQQFNEETMDEHSFEDSLLKLELVGTPIGNSTAVLLIHEVLHNLENSNIACIEQKTQLPLTFQARGLPREFKLAEENHVEDDILNNEKSVGCDVRNTFQSSVPKG